MDTEQAKSILKAWRSGESGPVDEGLLDQALAMMESDPVLAKWFEEQSATDVNLREALRTITPPIHLREAILASAMATPFPKQNPSRRYLVWLAAAAGVALAAGAFLILPAKSGRLQVAQIDAEIPRFTEAHNHPFGSGAGNMEQIRTWLKEHGGAAGFITPAGLVNRGGVGCEIASIRGKKVTILCFDLAKGGVVHLYIVERSQLADPPALNSPAFNQLGAYAVASWSHGKYSYFLARQGNTEALHSLL